MLKVQIAVNEIHFRHFYVLLLPDSKNRRPNSKKIYTVYRNDAIAEITVYVGLSKFTGENIYLEVRERSGRTAVVDDQIDKEYPRTDNTGHRRETQYISFES